MASSEIKVWEKIENPKGHMARPERDRWCLVITLQNSKPEISGNYANIYIYIYIYVCIIRVTSYLNIR